MWLDEGGLIEAAVKNKNIVEAAAAISLSSPEDGNMDP
jgi:hypothetical protein